MIKEFLFTEMVLFLGLLLTEVIFVVDKNTVGQEVIRTQSFVIEDFLVLDLFEVSGFVSGLFLSLCNVYWRTLLI